MGHDPPDRRPVLVWKRLVFKTWLDNVLITLFNRNFLPIKVTSSRTFGLRSSEGRTTPSVKCSPSTSIVDGLSSRSTGLRTSGFATPSTSCDVSQSSGRKRAFHNSSESSEIFRKRAAFASILPILLEKSPFYLKRLLESRQLGQFICNIDKTSCYLAQCCQIETK